MQFEENIVPKTIKYNWEVLKKHTNSDVKKMIEFFDNVYVRKTENYFYLNPWAALVMKDSNGNSHNFIQNVEGLITACKGATDSEIFVYLDLASKRNYFTFVNTKGAVNYLPFWKIDGYDVNALKMNRLLTFSDKNIYLLYEGDYNG